MSVYTKVKFQDVRAFLSAGKYPDSIKSDHGKRKNFRRQVLSFALDEHGVLFKLRGRDKGTKVQVVENEDERRTVMQAAHEGVKDRLQSAAVGAHVGQDKTYEKLTERFWWPGIRDDVRTFVKTCTKCQKRPSQFPKSGDCLHSREDLPHPWQHVGVNICGMPKSSEGFSHMAVAIDYSSKWIEAEPLKSKSAENVAVFLYNLICVHGCADVQINDHGRDFVDEVATSLYNQTGIKQKLRSGHQRQSKGFVDRRNRTLQDLLLKLMDENIDIHSGIPDWPKALPRVLFSLRTSRQLKQASTVYTPFYLLYGRHPTLPTNVMEDCDAEAMSRATEPEMSEHKPGKNRTPESENAKRKPARKMPTSGSPEPENTEHEPASKTPVPEKAKRKSASRKPELQNTKHKPVKRKRASRTFEPEAKSSRILERGSTKHDRKCKQKT